MNNLEELKKAALAVLELTDVKGCWQSSLLETKDRGAIHAIVTEHGDNICEATGDTVIDSVIIDYIESVSPTATLALIAQLEAAKKEITYWCNLNARKNETIGQHELLEGWALVPTKPTAEMMAAAILYATLRTISGFQIVVGMPKKWVMV